MNVKEVRQEAAGIIANFRQARAVLPGKEELWRSLRVALPVKY